MHLSRNFNVRSTDLRILFPVCPEAGVVSQRHWAISGLNASSTVMNRFTSIWKLKNGLLELQDWNNLPVDWSNLWTFSLACKQALCMGYSEICFWIARGRARNRRVCNGPCRIWVLSPFLLDWSFTSRHDCLTQQKQTRSPIATKKHKQNKPTFRSKHPRIIAWKLNLKWEHLFRT